MIIGMREAPYQRREGVPCPKGDHKTEPGKEENTSVDIYWIEERYRPGLERGWVDVWRRVKVRELEAHAARCVLGGT